MKDGPSVDYDSINLGKRCRRQSNVGFWTTHHLKDTLLCYFFFYHKITCEDNPLHFLKTIKMSSI